MEGSIRPDFNFPSYQEFIRKYTSMNRTLVTINAGSSLAPGPIRLRNIGFGDYFFASGFSSHTMNEPGSIWIYLTNGKVYNLTNRYLLELEDSVIINDFRIIFQVKISVT